MRAALLMGASIALMLAGETFAFAPTTSRGRQKPLVVGSGTHQRIFLDRRVVAAAGGSSTSRIAALSSEEGGVSQQPQQEDSSTSFSSPLDRPVLAALDAAALTTFAAVGKASHNTADGSLDVVAVAITAAPFLLAWFATSPLTGVYNRQDTAGAGGRSTTNVALASLGTTARGWAVAVPLGCLLRGILKGYPPPLPFVLVTLVATFVILGATRAVYAVVEEKLQQPSS